MPPKSKIQIAPGDDGAYGDEDEGYDGDNEVQWDHAKYLRRPHHMGV